MEIIPPCRAQRRDYLDEGRYESVIILRSEREWGETLGVQ